MPLIAGPVHDLGESVEIAVESPAAVSLNLAVPAQIGVALGEPLRYFDLGRAAVGTSAGWLQSFVLEHADQLLWPLPPSCSRLGLTLAVGVTGTAQEWTGDLVPADCADELAAMQSALDARDAVIAADVAEIADLHQQILDLGSGGGGGDGPIISAADVTTTPTTATVTWTTDLAADSQVEYGADTSYGQLSALLVALVTSHTVTVTGLTPGASYHFRARSAAPIGTTSGDLADSTPADPTLLYQASLVAPAPGTNSEWLSDAAIAPADWPIVVDVHNDLAAGGGTLSGGVVQCSTNALHLAGSFVTEIAPGATYSSGPIDYATTPCDGPLKVTCNADGVHAIPWTVTVRRAS